MYGQGRDSSTLTMTKTEADEIAFTLTDRMSDKLFHFPLTVKIKVDDTWQCDFTSLELTWQIEAATMRPTNLSLAGDTDYGKMTATATYTY